MYFYEAKVDIKNRCISFITEKKISLRYSTGKRPKYVKRVKMLQASDSGVILLILILSSTLVQNIVTCKRCNFYEAKVLE